MSEKHTRCAIFRVHGLALGYKYQVWAGSGPICGDFVGAYYIARQARRAARRHLNPQEPPKRLVAIVRRKETR
jgi:hypothetical protein